TTGVTAGDISRICAGCGELPVAFSGANGPIARTGSARSMRCSQYWRTGALSVRNVARFTLSLTGAFTANAIHALAACALSIAVTTGAAAEFCLAHAARAEAPRCAMRSDGAVSQALGCTANELPAGLGGGGLASPRAITQGREHCSTICARRLAALR